MNKGRASECADDGDDNRKVVSYVLVRWDRFGFPRLATDLHAKHAGTVANCGQK